MNPNQRSFIDVDMNFTKHPGTKDIIRRFDGDATKQAIRNLFLTNPFEKPFDPHYGLGVEKMLFELADLSDGLLANTLSRKIREMIYNYEPRVIIDNLTVSPRMDANTVDIALTYHTAVAPIPDNVSFSFRRAR